MCGSVTVLVCTSLCVCVPQLLPRFMFPSRTRCTRVQPFLLCPAPRVCEQRPCTSMGDSTCFTAYINLSARVGRFIPLCLPVPVRAPCVTVQAAPCACVCNAHTCALQAALPTAAHARAPALPPDPEQGIKLKSLLKGCKPTLLSRFPCFSNCQCLIIP